MPLYGKGKLHAWRYSRKRGLGNIIERDEQKRVRLRQETARWTQFKSPLGRVSTNIGIDIPAWIQRRHAQKRKPLTVLDWGCGDGTTIEQLAKRYPEEVHAYGYDHQSRRTWITSTRVKYIHNDATSMLRYIKKGSMDLIYSHYGLTHLLYGQSLPERIRYTQRLAERLKPGGLFSMNFDSKHEMHIRPVAEALQRLLGKEYDVKLIINPQWPPKRFLHVQRLE
ncbi:MAG: class I SAM-dependent methyltransferase [Candidatus Iainarchaeum archaeon]|uniref:Class I SAM-dependent methyltransferase n=1 Tax=Candidatus Iainarchaeum sp. TaxID=3101447 RepID=A0A7T9DKH9_9ARCH|nr:MAG: class I SAM-dependent methyltransferase [Candidatus Diapherotrites archaeon]